MRQPNAASIIETEAQKSDNKVISLTSSEDKSKFVLMVTNPFAEDLVIPKDLLNGPRNMDRSVFIFVTDINNVPVKRCAIVEVSDKNLASINLPPGKTTVIPVSRFLVEATYCVSSFHLQAIVGSSSIKDKRITSNKILIN